MNPELEDSVSEIRQLAARGEFPAARRRLEALLLAAADSPADAPTPLVEELPRLSRTLEVLESIDVVRRLLREGDHAAASGAAARIAERLSRDDYAELGVSGAALALLNRAGELAYRMDSGRGGAGTEREIRNFVDYMGSELGEMERRRFDDELRRLVQSKEEVATAGAGASTLGDLLARRPWRSGLHAVADHPKRDSSTSAAIPVVERPGAEGEAPVIGKILIEQEPRPRAAAPETATGGDGSGADLFDVVGKAVARNWYAVLASVLIFSVLGYLIAVAAPTRYTSRAILQKTQQSGLRAPLTGNTETYVPSLPRATVLKLATLRGFHDKVAAYLLENGWKPSPGEPAKRFADVNGDVVGAALEVSVDSTGSDSYYIEFAVTHGDPDLAMALADTSAIVFQEFHKEQLIEEARENLKTYEERRNSIADQLKLIQEKRQKEISFGTGASTPGFSPEERTRNLMTSLEDAKSKHELAQTRLDAAGKELANFERVLESTPEKIESLSGGRTWNPVLESHRDQLQELEKSIIELERELPDLGPKHPKIDEIRELKEDRRLLEARIKELEALPENSTVTPNPAYTTAALRVEQARSAVQSAETDRDYWAAKVKEYEAELASEDLASKMLESEELQREEKKLLDQQDRNDLVIEELGAVIDTADRELKLVQPAVRAVPVPAKVLVGIAVGLVVGLVVGVAVAIGLLRRRQLSQA